jgi:hypothetical protein
VNKLCSDQQRVWTNEWQELVCFAARYQVSFNSSIMRS